MVFLAIAQVLQYVKIWGGIGDAKMLLSQTEVNVLRMMALGFGAREIANAIQLDFNEFNGLYSSLLAKTLCWDELALGMWWAKYQHEYLSVSPNNLVCFDFTKT